MADPGIPAPAARARPSDGRRGRRLLRAAEILAVTGHDRFVDGFSRGTWSVFGRGHLLGALPVLPHGRVLFAGSDIADGWNGFMDGAIESGPRAGREATRLLGAAQEVTAW